MHPELKAWLRCIWEAPAAELAGAIGCFADWLEERGDGRAERVRERRDDLAKDEVVIPASELSAEGRPLETWCRQKVVLPFLSPVPPGGLLSGLATPAQRISAQLGSAGPGG